MQVVNFTEARNNLKSIFDSECENHEEMIVNRKNGDNIVIVSLEDFNALKETQYLLSSSKNRERLLNSLEHSRSGKVVSHELIEE
jgi:antitoxin YefM